MYLTTADDSVSRVKRYNRGAAQLLQSADRSAARRSYKRQYSAFDLIWDPSRPRAVRSMSTWWAFKRAVTSVLFLIAVN